jgi:signal transduction histidine kinase
MKRKFLYNKFLRAISEIIFVILLMIVMATITISRNLYTLDILGNSKDFYNSKAIAEKSNYYSKLLSEYIYNHTWDYYDNSDTIGNSKNDYKNAEYDSDDEYEDDVSNQKDSEVCYTCSSGYENYYISYSYYDGIKNFATYISEVKEKIQTDVEHISKNYAYKIRYKDELLATNINDDDEYQYVNSAVHYVYGIEGEDNIYNKNYITVDNYVSKNIVEGDDFYDCKRWYNFYNNNFRLILIISGIAVVFAIILGIYIILTTGYNQNGKLERSWLDNIPIELYALITYLYIEILANCIYDIGDTNIIIIMLVVGVGFLLWILLMDVKTILSRLKNKVFLQNSIIGRIMIVGWNAIKNIIVDMDKKWKAAMTIGGIFACETFVVMIIAALDYEKICGIIIWLIIKVVQFILLMYIYSIIYRIRNGASAIHEGKTEVKIDTEKMYGIFKEIAGCINDISVGLDKAVAEKMKSEQLKTELITNVSHDIKTPLTSIINYIDLMKKEKIENEKVQEYLKVVDKQSLRLNKLTEDVIEASKAATGNINVELSSLNLSEMLAQSLGEYENKFKEKELDIVYSEQTLPVSVMADGRLLWRVIENLFSNVYKYAMEGTRLYIDIDNDEEYVKIIMKNVSKYQLNISSDELMQRFVRGDSSRSTSGNGLGLSIAESLTKLQGGTLDIQIIGDSFIAVLNLRKPRSIVPEQNQ